MDESGNELLDMANALIESVKIGNRIGLAKQLNPNEFIAVTIRKGTKEEIEAMR